MSRQHQTLSLITEGFGELRHLTRYYLVGENILVLWDNEKTDR
jgi:hypothetical protein